MYACVVFDGHEVRVAHAAREKIVETTLDPQTVGSLEEVLVGLAERVGRLDVVAIVIDSAVVRNGVRLSFPLFEWADFIIGESDKNPAYDTTAVVDPVTCATASVGLPVQCGHRVIWRGGDVGQRQLTVVLDGTVDVRGATRPNARTLLRSGERSSMGGLLWQPWSKMSHWLLRHRDSPKTYADALNVKSGPIRLAELLAQYPPFLDETEAVTGLRGVPEFTARTSELNPHAASLAVLNLAKQGNVVAIAAMKLWGAFCGQFLYQTSRTLLPPQGGTVCVVDQHILGDAYLGELVIGHSELLSRFRMEHDNRYTLLLAHSTQGASRVALGAIKLARRVKIS